MSARRLFWRRCLRAVAHCWSDQPFVESSRFNFPEALRDVVDIGCGPWEVMVRLAQARPSIQITAVDGSAAMIEIGSNSVRLGAAEIPEPHRLFHADPAPGRCRARSPSCHFGRAEDPSAFSLSNPSGSLPGPRRQSSLTICLTGDVLQAPVSEIFPPGSFVSGYP